MDRLTDPLGTFAYTVLSNDLGEITITVTNEDGFETGIAGLAIVPTRPIGPAVNGSISGQKWNDDGAGDIDNSGNQAKDQGEAGLPDWMIYNDLDNNGELNHTTTPDVTVTQPSPEPGQNIPDGNFTGIKSSVLISQIGTVADINVTLDITHEYDGDLHVSLISPGNKEIVLIANVGGTTGLSGFRGTTLDDEAG